MNIIGNKKLVLGIVVFLTVVSICLAFISDNGMVFDVERTISFIVILSGLFGIFSIFINFQVLTEVKNIEEQRSKTISKIKEEIFFRDEIVRAKEAINKLSTKTTKQDFLQDTTTIELAVVRSICENPLIKDKTQTRPESKSIFSRVQNMDEEITKYRNNITNTEQDCWNISPSLITNFRKALDELKHILDENVAITASYSMIPDKR